MKWKVRGEEGGCTQMWTTMILDITTCNRSRTHTMEYLSYTNGHYSCTVHM